MSDDDQEYAAALAALWRALALNTVLVAGAIAVLVWGLRHA